jgi:ferredoxin-type protein NapH
MTDQRRPRWHVWTWARRLTALLFLASLIAGSSSWFPWWRGSTSATTLLDTVPFVDPLAALEAALASGTLAWPMVLGAATPLVVAVLLGPVFCGWLCPLGLLMDVNQSLRKTITGRLLRYAATRRQSPPWLRSIVLGVVLGFALVGGLPLFQAVSPINLLIRGVLFGTTIGLLAVAVLIVAEWRWPRLWCQALCPLGALYGLVGRRGLFRVRIDPHLAGQTPCHRCTRSCPMGIPVVEAYVAAGKQSIDDPACIRCGACADVCPRDGLHLGFRHRRPSGAAELSICGSAIEQGMASGRS